MPRIYIIKNNNNYTDGNLMERAVFEVITNKRSIRNVAIDYNIKRVTLGRYVNKYKNKEIKDVT